MYIDFVTPNKHGFQQASRFVSERNANTLKIHNNNFI